MDNVDFTRAKQFDRDDVQIYDLDLSTARAKPFAIGLAGKNIFVSLQAWDDEYTLSTTKSVGKAVAILNNGTGNPLELSAGLAYQLQAEFDDILVLNTAQPNMMMRIYASSDALVYPFSGEIQVIGDAPAALDDVADVALVAAAAHARVLPVLATRLSCVITNIGANPARIGKQPTNTRGHYLAPGASVALDGTFEVRGFSQLGTTLSTAWTTE